MTRFRAALTLTILLAASAPLARADLVHLNTGGVVKGDIVAESDTEVKVKTASGSVTVIFREDIERIERGQSGDSVYKEGLKKLSPTDADGHYQLGQELRKLHLEKEARDCFERALKIEPNHLLAKMALGDSLAKAADLAPAVDDEKSAARDEAAPAVAKGKLPADVLKQVESLRKQARDDDPARRAAAWDAIRALHAAQPPELAPVVLASLASLESAPRKLYERNARKLAQAIPDYDGGSAGVRDRARETWEAATKVALDTIFDLTIYPDENHGRIGQKTVDEKVDVVRKAFPAYDQLVTHDLTKFSSLSEEQAKTFVAVLAKTRALVTEALAGLEPLGAEGLKPLPEEPPAGQRALLFYRAGRIEEAWSLRDKLTPWEVHLVERLRDLRVEGYNDRLLSDKAAPAKGKRPNGEERLEVAITNKYRMLMGREALEIHPCLEEAARGHSQEMSQLGYFAHESPVAANKTPSDRVRNAGYEGSAGENISEGSMAPQATHDAWYNSSGHHRNILSTSWKAMGAGLDGRHWTQDFGGNGLLSR